MLLPIEVKIAFEKGDINKDTALSMLQDVIDEAFEAKQEARLVVAEHTKRWKEANAYLRDIRGDVPPPISGEGGVLDVQF